MRAALLRFGNKSGDRDRCSFVRPNERTIRYRIRPGTITLIHTDVAPWAEGHGIGSRLVAGATGNVHRLAYALGDGAAGEGAEVRIRHVEDLALEMLISQNQYWGRHRSEVEDEPVATLADLEWADGVAFGTPTRFGNVAAQLKQFMNQ